MSYNKVDFVIDANFFCSIYCSDNIFYLNTFLDYFKNSIIARLASIGNETAPGCLKCLQQPFVHSIDSETDIKVKLDV